MSKLTGTFSDSASAKDSSALFGASLDLIVADTRRGMDARTQQAFLQVSAHAGADPRRTAYLQHYKAAAGAGGQALKARPAGFKM